MKKILIIGDVSETLLKALRAAKYELIFETLEKENIKEMEFDSVFINEAAPICDADWQQLKNFKRRIK